MDNWHFISRILTDIIDMMQTGGDALLNNAIGYVRPIILAGMGAWIAAQAVAVAFANAPIKSLYNGLFRAAVVVAVLQSAATYNQWLGSIALALPNEVGVALATVGGNITSGGIFDTLLNEALKSGLTVWKHIPSYSFSGAMLTLAVLGFWVESIVCIGGGALIYGASTVLLMLLVKVGPLFLALFPFPQTRRFANGWATAVISAIATQVFSLAILILFVGAEQTTLPAILANASNGTDPNFVEECITLIEAGYLMWVVWTLVKQASSIASHLVGGVHQHVGAFTSAIGGVPAQGVAAAQGAVGVAGKAISGTANAARSISSQIDQRRVNRANP